MKELWPHPQSLPRNACIYTISGHGPHFPSRQSDRRRAVTDRIRKWPGPPDAHRPRPSNVPPMKAGLGSGIVTEDERLLNDPKAYSGVVNAIYPYGDGHATARSIDAIAEFLAVPQPSSNAPVTLRLTRGVRGRDTTGSADCGWIH